MLLPFSQTMIATYLCNTLNFTPTMDVFPRTTCKSKSIHRFTTNQRKYIVYLRDATMFLFNQEILL